jgi:hypothetical protein
VTWPVGCSPPAPLRASTSNVPPRQFVVPLPVTESSRLGFDAPGGSGTLRPPSFLPRVVTNPTQSPWFRKTPNVRQPPSLH